ncbi:glycosyltransferase involved in cell wall biosynthesis [Humitalea rosea]|uniref:Glycosyltransferase involved in cell wall biosynthesis n=1 Tax=Humitalea rosea TaxID=990373 RepID=A0A2W7IL90_9PROT|nr:glycosyltransferase family 4 protein [Humitalea rosea]PZW46767.1 glycosyltransferase involved in cell wall biosynthesis [Humitalea rosea]
MSQTLAQRPVAGLPSTAPLLLHVFPSFAVGGAQVRFAAVANRFGPRWRHAVVALDGQTDCALRIDRGVSLTLVRPPAGGGGPQRLLGIAAVLRRLRPALLVTSNWGSIEWAIANLASPRLPHLHTEDGFGKEESGGQIGRRVLARRLSLRWSTVVLPSTTLLRAARSWRLPEARLHHIPNGLDLRHFTPSGPKAALAVPGEGPLIGIVAALRPEKNLGRLLRAAALLRRDGAVFRLVIIGEGPEREMLEALAAELGIAEQVLFAGHMPDPAAAYRALDVFCLCSDTEQMPFSVLEAMASGLPVAATDVGDIRTMLAPENHPHIARPDDAALASALHGLLGDPPLRRRLGAANRARAEQVYDQETMFQSHAALIDGLVAR